jgi:response regulator of citrate/malate metabolism
VLADASTRSGDGSTGAADSDLDLPETLTVAELADGIDRSRTIHELTRDIGVSRETARRLLQRYNLVHFVSRSMAAEQVTVSPDQVVRRLTAASR